MRRECTRNQETRGFVPARSPCDPGQVTAPGLHVTTHGMFRMDVPSSEVLGKTQGMIQSSAGPKGTSEEPADGESSAEPGAVTRASMWDVTSRPVALLCPLPCPLL